MGLPGSLWLEWAFSCGRRNEKKADYPVVWLNRSWSPRALMVSTVIDAHPSRPVLVSMTVHQNPWHKRLEMVPFRSATAFSRTERGVHVHVRHPRPNRTPGSERRSNAERRSPTHVPPIEYIGIYLPYIVNYLIIYVLHPTQPLRIHQFPRTNSSATRSGGPGGP